MRPKKSKVKLPKQTLDSTTTVRKKDDENDGVSNKYNFKQTINLNRQLKLNLNSNKISNEFDLGQKGVERVLTLSVQNQNQSLKRKTDEKIDRRFKKYRDFKLKDKSALKEVDYSNDNRVHPTTNQLELENFRIGDWVFCDFDDNKPFFIRKIEEFCLNDNGDIECKLRCAYRRSDLSQSLLNLVEKRFTKLFTCIESTLAFPSIRESELNNEQILEKIYQERETDSERFDRAFDLKLIDSIRSLTNEQIIKLKEREIYYSRYSESNIPISKIISKLDVNIYMSHLNTLTDYTNEDEIFFYQVFYDPNLKLLSQDKSEIRVGEQYQASIPDCINDKYNESLTDQYETLIFNGPESEKLGKISISKYFNRIINEKLKINEKSNPNCEIMQTRDAIMYDAMRHLHQNDYDWKKSIKNFKFDKIENFDYQDERTQRVWTQNEMQIFKLAFESKECGKDFYKIRKDFLPMKFVSTIIEYYYNIWKINDDYIHKRDEKREKKKSLKITEIKLPNKSLNYSADCFESKSNNCLDAKRSQFKTKQKDTNAAKEKKFRKISRCDFEQASANVAVSNSNLNLNQDIYLCFDCWIYWKKYAGYRLNCQTECSSSKINELSKDLVRKRAEDRSRQATTHLYKCKHVSYCMREFVSLHDFKKHLIYAHGLRFTSRKLNQKSDVQICFEDMKLFYFKPNNVLINLRCAKTKFFKKIGRNPFHEISNQVFNNLTQRNNNTENFLKAPFKSSNKSLLKVIRKLSKKKTQTIDERSEPFLNDFILLQSRPLTPLSTNSSSCESECERKMNKQTAQANSSALFSSSSSSETSALTLSDINESFNSESNVISMRILDHIIDKPICIDDDFVDDNDDDCIIIL